MGKKSEWLAICPGLLKKNIYIAGMLEQHGSRSLRPPLLKKKARSAAQFPAGVPSFSDKIQAEFQVLALDVAGFVEKRICPAGVSLEMIPDAPTMVKNREKMPESFLPFGPVRPSI